MFKIRFFFLTSRTNEPKIVDRESNLTFFVAILARNICEKECIAFKVGKQFFSYVCAYIICKLNFVYTYIHTY